jgi:hypothetical protein
MLIMPTPEAGAGAAAEEVVGVEFPPQPITTAVKTKAATATNNFTDIPRLYKKVKPATSVETHCTD